MRPGRYSRSASSQALKTFTFETSLFLPHPRARVFAFFSDAANLELITPEWLRFDIATPTPVDMEVGTYIDYRLRFRGFPIEWRSEILVWDPPHRFVDSQIKGPYRKWVHEHKFDERKGGTIASDHVEYSVPGGALVNTLFVRYDVERIFAYRRQRLIELFDKSADVNGRDT